MVKISLTSSSIVLNRTVSNRLTPSQIELVERPGERAFLCYTEDVLKNHQGGLKGRKGKRKVVVQHENSENASWCFVRLFKLYLSKCPQN